MIPVAFVIAGDAFKVKEYGVAPPLAVIVAEPLQAPAHIGPSVDDTSEIDDGAVTVAEEASVHALASVTVKV
jgi:hypothetical protein